MQPADCPFCRQRGREEAKRSARAREAKLKARIEELEGQLEYAVGRAHDAEAALRVAQRAFADMGNSDRVDEIEDVLSPG